MINILWPDCTDPTVMLAKLRRCRKQRRPSARKLRLFGCACCRRVWHLVQNQQLHEALNVAERWADGLASKVEWEKIWDEYDWLYEANDATIIDLITLGDAIPDGSNSRLVPETVAARAARWAASLLWQRQRLHKREINKQASLLRDILGNPFHPVTLERSWLSPAVVSLAAAIYTERTFDRMPILADALEEAGCDSDDILTHCRQPGEHVRGCWVVDLVLGKK